MTANPSHNAHQKTKYKQTSENNGPQPRPMKRKQHRRGQVQMGETIAVLLVFFFLIVIGMVFYVNVIKSKSAAAKDENSQLEAVSALKRALTLPELSCSRQDISTGDCVDLLKLKAASGIMPQNQEHYFDLLG